MDCLCGAIMILHGHTDWGALIFVCPACGWQYAEEWEPVNESVWEWHEDEDDELPAACDGLPF